MKKYDDLQYKDMDEARYKRAHRFTNAVLALMRDFIPHDRDCYRLMTDHLMRLGYEQNAEFINVPPEWDEFNKLEIERALLEAKIAPVILGEMLRS